MTVMSSVNFMILVLLWETQSCVKRMYSSGLRTQPWVVSLLTVLIPDVQCPVLTD